jgi:thiamine biosynthesis lipoprotein ApbE
LLSASVSGPNLALADALATGLLAGGEPALAAVASVEGYDTLVVRDDGTLLATGLMSAR